MNTIFTYTTSVHDRQVTTTYSTTWKKACEDANNLLLYCSGIDNVRADWYDDTNRLVLRRRFFRGSDFITNKPVIYADDTEY